MAVKSLRLGAAVLLVTIVNASKRASGGDTALRVAENEVDKELDAYKVTDADVEAALSMGGESLQQATSDNKGIEVVSEKAVRMQPNALKPFGDGRPFLARGAPSVGKNDGSDDDDAQTGVADILRGISSGVEKKAAGGDIQSIITKLVSSNSLARASPMAESLKRLKDLISNRMMGALLDAHSASQTELHKLMSDLHDCNASKTESWKEIEKQNEIYTRNSPLHKECRQTEALRLREKNTCIDEEAQRKQVKDIKCSLYAKTAVEVSNEVENTAIVKRGGGESVETYVVRVSATICGGNRAESSRRRGGSGESGGHLDRYDTTKQDCVEAREAHKTKATQCVSNTEVYDKQKKKCDAYQDLMDGGACKRAVLTKDACETYAECYAGKHETYDTARNAVMVEEKNRKGEWKGLKKMHCLLEAFEDGKVTKDETDDCMAVEHDVDHLVITYPDVPDLHDCVIPSDYPTTSKYNEAQYADLPSEAPQKEPMECTGLMEIATKPGPGSPDGCKCSRVILNGPFSPGPIVKCENCIDVHRSLEKNSCPEGTKIFSPRSELDWQTFLQSAEDLRSPNFLVDITRPFDGIGNSANHTMNSANEHQATWKTSDGSPWWLSGDQSHNPSSGNYLANCYMNVNFVGEDREISWNYDKCEYHSSSYYCQARAFSTKPATGSPQSCSCTKVDLAGPYSAKLLLKCEQCLPVRKSTEKSSCPTGTKIFAPATQEDWRTFFKSALPLRSPHWIVDVTRPEDGCGGCGKYPMNSGEPNQATWKTSDGSPWWLRSTNNDQLSEEQQYQANCFLDLSLPAGPVDENTIEFQANKCEHFSNSYYCQPARDTIDA